MSMTPTTMSVGHLTALLPSWQTHLEAENKSPRTIQSYLEAATQLATFLTEHGMPVAVNAVTREHVEAFLVDRIDRHSASTAANRYRSLRRLFAWLEEEGEIGASPMARMRQPKVPEAIVPVIEGHEVLALLAACKGNGLPERRDAALFSVFYDTGGRLEEITSVRVGDVERTTMLLHGKGGKDRVVPLGPAAAKALDRYVRARMRHPHADLPWLWLGTKGRLTASGVTQMMRRRARQAGVAGLHPHRFRHSFADAWLAAGGQANDLMRLAGWSSPEMVLRYGASAAGRRARAAHANLSPLDRLIASR